MGNSTLLSVPSDRERRVISRILIVFGVMPKLANSFCRPGPGVRRKSGSRLAQSIREVQLKTGGKADRGPPAAWDRCYDRPPRSSLRSFLQTRIPASRKRILPSSQPLFPCAPRGPRRPAEPVAGKTGRIPTADARLARKHRCWVRRPLAIAPGPTSVAPPSEGARSFEWEKAGSRSLPPVRNTRSLRIQPSLPTVCSS